MAGLFDNKESPASQGTAAAQPTTQPTAQPTAQQPPTVPTTSTPHVTTAVVVDGSVPDRSNLWEIAKSNARTLLNSRERERAMRMGGEVEVARQALLKLFKLNPNFDPALQDGHVSLKHGRPDMSDPDYVRDGSLVVVYGN